MTSNEHKKHASLVRPTTGKFGRNEWAIVGAPCVNIKVLANDVIQALSTDYKCAYLDALHNDEVTSLPGRLAAGAYLEGVDQQNYYQFNYAITSTFDLKQQFLATDIVLVNGNHHEGNAQVVVIHPNKMASLQKRLHQLTNVELILFAEGVYDVFDFVKEAIPEWKSIPTYALTDTDNIIAFFKGKLSATMSTLKGLVLAGGKSIRMGQDKGTLNWHGTEQRNYMANILTEFCSEVYISCRSDQKAEIDSPYNLLEDTFTRLGPFGAILSAFRHDPNSAWLVVACDLPLLDKPNLQHLTENRDVSAFATAFNNEEQGFPEPLITIWEPKSYPRLLAWLAQGYSCPRKVLINSDIKILEPLNKNALTNVNTPDELQRMKAQLHSSQIDL